MRRFSVYSILFVVTSFLSINFSSAESSKPKIFKSSSTQTQILELYSTQSCSSCPPAQDWVSNLKGHPQLFKSFIPVVLHVDYWDYLGWKDPYSSNQFTLRQRSYASKWRSSRIYTPMFVLNGAEWRGRRIGQLTPEAKTVGIVTAKLVANSPSSSTYEVEFTPSSDLQKPEKLVLVSTLLGSGIKTSVKAGENSGRILGHDFLALNFQRKAVKKSGNTYRTKVTIQTNTKSAPQKHIVFWFADPSSMKPIQSVVGNMN